MHTIISVIFHMYHMFLIRLHFKTDSVAKCNCSNDCEKMP